MTSPDLTVQFYTRLRDALRDQEHAFDISVIRTLLATNTTSRDRGDSTNWRALGSAIALLAHTISADDQRRVLILVKVLLDTPRATQHDSLEQMLKGVSIVGAEGLHQCYAEMASMIKPGGALVYGQQITAQCLSGALQGGNSAVMQFWLGSRLTGVDKSLVRRAKTFVAQSNGSRGQPAPKRGSSLGAFGNGLSRATDSIRSSGSQATDSRSARRLGLNRRAASTTIPPSFSAPRQRSQNKFDICLGDVQKGYIDALQCLVDSARNLEESQVSRALYALQKVEFQEKDQRRATTLKRMLKRIQTVKLEELRLFEDDDDE